MVSMIDRQMSLIRKFYNEMQLFKMDTFLYWLKIMFHLNELGV